jgi:hypothetical protein
MPPIFPRQSNLIAKASILVGLVIGLAITASLIWYTHSSAYTRVGVPVPQPVPFSHTLHVGALGLDCRYCHASVEKSSFADIPPTETCMTCHSQIRVDAPDLAPVRESWQTGKPIVWNRVNQLPDYVYFDHQIHIAKGVGCETCHGRVDKMTTDVKANTFYMSWCLNCHRDPAKYLRPQDQVFTMGYQPAEDQQTLGTQLVAAYHVLPPSQLTNCSTCHR